MCRGVSGPGFLLPMAVQVYSWLQLAEVPLASRSSERGREENSRQGIYGPAQQRPSRLFDALLDHAGLVCCASTVDPPFIDYLVPLASGFRAILTASSHLS